MRNIIQICVSTTNWEDEITKTVIALCNDNTVWQLSYNGKSWFKLPAIPQPLSKDEEEYINHLVEKDRKNGGLDEEEKEMFVHLLKRV